MAKGPVSLDEVELYDRCLHPFFEIVDHLHLRPSHSDFNGGGGMGTGGDDRKSLSVLAGDGDCVDLCHILSYLMVELRLFY